MLDSSDHGASGPGVINPCCPYSATPVASNGGTARHRPYQTGLVTFAIASGMHGNSRMTPSAARLNPYAPNRPTPANAPRARYSIPNVTSAMTRQMTNPAWSLNLCCTIWVVPVSTPMPAASTSVNTPPSRPARDHRTAAHAPGEPRRHRAPDFLLERQEDARREHEDADPQGVQRGVVGFAQPAEREDLEAVGGDTGDREPGADREGALGHHPARPLDRGRARRRHRRVDSSVIRRAQAQAAQRELGASTPFPLVRSRRPTTVGERTRKSVQVPD